MDAEVIRWFGLAAAVIIYGSLIGSAVLAYLAERREKNAKGIENHGR